MTVRKNSWIRRVIAAGMAMGMVVSTTLPSLAEGVAGDGYGSQITVEDGLASTDSAEKAEAADGMESAETESSQDGTDTVAPEEQTGYSENEQEGQQTEAATEAQEQKVQWKTPAVWSIP